MPLLPNLADLKGLANSFNPLNAFSTPESPSTPSRTTPASPTSSTPPSAVAGPGPSTMSIGARSTLAPGVYPASQLGPIRPSISTNKSSTDSLDGTPGRRKSSASVVIASPEVMRPGERAAGPSRVGKNVKADGTPATASTNPGAAPSDKRRRRVPLDTYIIVKPPPTASKNPLNLQIQLVVKSDTRRERSQSALSIRSIDTSTPSVSPTHPPADLPQPASDAAVVDLSESNSDETRSNSPARTIGEDDAGSSGVQRAVSLKSSVSQRSSSMSTVASTGTGGSFGGGSRKRVEPMFNLAVHNVMHPTTVTDAATDFKVAKFLKRSLDIAGVGLLEPAEVWLPSPNAPANLFPLPSNSDDGHLPQPNTRRTRPVSMVSLTTPISPIITRSDDGRHNVRNSLDLKKASLDLKGLRVDGLLGSKEDSGAKKFFGKMFKKKNAPATIMPQVRKSPSPSVSNESTDTIPPPKSAVALSEPHGHAHLTLSHPTFGTAPLIVHRRSSGTIVSPDGAVTGLTASAPAPTPGLAPPKLEQAVPNADGTAALPMIPSSRPVGYTWTVRRWAKKNTDGWAAHLVAAAAAGLELVNGAFSTEGEDEVVFEWVKLKPQAVGSTIMRRYSVTGTISSAMARETRARSKSPFASRTSLSLAPAKRTASPMPPSSPAPDGRPSGSPRKVSDTDTASLAHTDEDDDSDPEDSETPWTCSVWVKKTGQRLLLGTLTPAPHHPKVIGVLKIPMGLDPVALAQLNATGGVGAGTGTGTGAGAGSRTGSGSGSGGGAGGAGGAGGVTGAGAGARTAELAEIEKRVKEEVALTEENLKDVVCVTAMWLVAREEFGGLGRRRKN